MQIALFATTLQLKFACGKPGLKKRDVGIRNLSVSACTYLYYDA